MKFKPIISKSQNIIKNIVNIMIINLPYQTNSHSHCCLSTQFAMLYTSNT